jgi:signal transduction histidine kinase
MTARIAETLLGAQSDMQRIHRRVVRVGAVAAWAAAALFLGAGSLTGTQDLLIEAVGPILAAGFMTSQILLHREHGGIALLGSAVVVVVMYGVVGNPDTLIPAALSLVIISAIGTLFIASRRFLVIAGLTMFLAAAPSFWGVEFPSALMIGAVMGLSFIMTSMIFYTVRNAATTLNAKFQVLFEQSPTAAFEEDWSESLSYIRSEYDGRPERIKPFLLAFPSVVRRAVALASVIRVNRAAVDLLEASGPGDILGSRDPAIVTEENLESFVDVLTAVYEGREFFEVEAASATFKGRPIWLQARCVDNSRGANPSTILVAMADVTHVRANEAAMEQIIRAKDEFVASISHELRTPLTAVVGLTSELTSSSITPTERDELMGLASMQAEEMALIVEDLLVASRADVGTVAVSPTEIDLCAQVATAIHSVGVNVTASCDKTHIAHADPGRVRQILRNLLTNVERYGGPNPRVVCGELQDRVWIELRDDGAGVPPQHADRIFRPYATAHAGVTSSVGLGLAVARQLAELMNGTLTYRRDLDESVFRLELPATLSPAKV